MPEPLPVRHLHVDLAEPDPLVVIDRPLTERPPPALLAVRCISHPTTLERLGRRRYNDSRPIKTALESVRSERRFGAYHALIPNYHTCLPGMAR